MAKRIDQNRSEGVDGNVSEKFLADLRGMLWKHIGKEGDFSEIAEKAGLNKTTISRLMWQTDTLSQTRRPHFETVVRLLRALDRLELLKKVFEGDHKPIKYGRTK